ncbi:helix-turn-helix domain-containing protein [Nioella sp.]|uniref:helix-turn-helix domain-containing protein n=1 Tax=Nioella sp. TaxID=1912091 RepID=UPI003A891499
MRRSDICLYLGPADRAELQALLTNRNTPRKLAWRAGIVLATADGNGTTEIMRRTGMSKPTVWRWQERYRECPELCVSGPVPAVSDTQASKRSPNIMANWLRAANHSLTFRPSFSKLRMAR